jgi:hypothetical protein
MAASTERQRPPKSDAKPRGAAPQRGLPFLPMVPAIILVVGVATTAAITWLGVEQLREQSDRATALQSKALALTLGERLRATPHKALGPDGVGPIPREEIGERILREPDTLFDRVIARAADRSGAELLVVDEAGKIIVDETDGAAALQNINILKKLGSGDAQASHGRAHFYATRLSAPLDGLWLIAFVPAAETPYATSPLVRYVLLFALGLIGVAAFVAYLLARSVHSDVSYVRDRIMAMTTADSVPGGQAIVVRGVDQVGQLTVAFNRLVERFYAAEPRAAHAAECHPGLR